MATPPGDAEPTPALIRAWREAQGLTHDQVLHRTGITPQALLQYESGHGGLTPMQVEVLARALRPVQPPPPQPGMLDFGWFATLLYLVGGAVPAIAACVTAWRAVRYIAPERAVAEVVGFEHHQRIAEPTTGERYAYETISPLLRFVQPDGAGPITVPWRETTPSDVPFMLGDRMWVYFPRGMPEAIVLSITETLLIPVLLALFAAPVLAVGVVSLRRLLRRRDRQGG